MRRRKVLVLAVAVALSGALSCAVGPEVREEVRELYDLSLSHTNVVEHLGEGGPRIEVMLLRGSPEGVLEEGGMRLYYRARGSSDFATVFMGRAGTSTLFHAEVPHQERGTWVDYFIEVRGIGGELLTFPGDAGEGNYYPLRFKGSVPRPLLAAHIGSMFLGLLLFVFAAYRSWMYLKRKGAYEGIEKWSLYGLGLIFIGGFPLGFLMGYYTFGIPWTGFPVGGDVTDTKTLIVFTCWLLIALFFRSPGAGSADERKQRRYSWLVIAGTLLTIVIYIIPHSI